MFDLDGKVAVVTGAASGIGAGVAAVLAEAGADVAVVWHPGHDHDAEPVLRAVSQHGRGATAIAADLSQPGAAERVVSEVVEALGHLDIVVANAAIAPATDALSLTDERWQAVMDVNLLGVFRCFRAALPEMLESGWGRLLATCSTSGALLGWEGHVHYTAAKAGLIGLVRSLALEVGRHGITVNAVAPGLVPTPMSLDPAVSLGPDAVHAFKQFVPVGHNGTPRDIGAAFAFLASDEASFITGQTLIVDGGMTFRPPA